MIFPAQILIAFWDGDGRVIGRWKSAYDNQLAWLICIAICKPVGIPPIIYLTCCQSDRNQLGSRAERSPLITTLPREMFDISW